jgi:hypothetical protein
MRVLHTFFIRGVNHAHVLQGDEGSSLRYLDTKTQVPVLFAIASPPVETMCPTTLHSLYTNVGAHTKWINSVTGLKNK